MHRNELLALLNNYRTSVLTEAGYVQQAKHFIMQYDDCFHSEHWDGHVTGSAWVVNQDKTKALMLHHKKQNQWFQPGGHADRDSDIRRVSLREVHEETGLDPSDIKLLSDQIFDVDIHVIPASQYGPRHQHYDIRFLMEVNDQIEIPGNDESHAIQWVPLYQAVQFNHNMSTYRMVEKTRRLQAR